MKIILFFYILFQTAFVQYDNLFNIENNKIFLGNESTVTKYFPNGGVEFEGNFAFNKNGELSELNVGDWKEFYNNGQLKERGTYEITSFIDCGPGGYLRFFMPYKVGNWNYYSENGELIASGTYATKKLHIKTRCEGGDSLYLGIIDSSWKFSGGNNFNRIDFETIEMNKNSFSMVYFYNREKNELEAKVNFCK